MTISEAFAQYGAIPKNRMWAWSAIAKDGSLVLSLWQQFFKNPSGTTSLCRYEDLFTRFDTNDRGKKLACEHLLQAVESGLPVRVIIGYVEREEDRTAIERGEPAHKIKKSFDIKKGWVGRVVELTDERFVIDFQTDSGKRS